MVTFKSVASACWERVEDLLNWMECRSEGFGALFMALGVLSFAVGIALSIVFENGWWLFLWVAGGGSFWLTYYFWEILWQERSCYDSTRD